MAASYEVTDGTKVYGTFSSQAKADALKKELKAEGVKARVRITYDAKPAKTKKAAEPKIPKTVKKSTPKPVKPKPMKPKATQEKPKDAPKVQDKPKKAIKKKGPLNKVKAKGFPIPPTDYKGSRVPLDYIKRALENTLDCIKPDGCLVEIDVKSNFVNVATRFGVEPEQLLLECYDYPKLESDGRYLKLTSRQGLVHWYLIEDGLDYPDVPVAPERPKVDCSTCSIEQLIDVLYEIQEPDVQFMEKKEIRAALSNPSMTVGLCDQFLNHTLYTEQFFDRWEESGRTEKDVQALRSRLNRLKLEAESYIASTVPDEPPAPVEKPKKGLLKKKSKSKSGLDARADFMKRMCGPLMGLGMDFVPLSESQFTQVDNAHICMIRFQNKAGESFFGLPGGAKSPGQETAAIDLIMVRDNIGSYFDADGNPIPARLKADAHQVHKEPKMPELSLMGSFSVDPAAFKKELGRSKKMVRAGKNRSRNSYNTNAIRFYSREGDLIMSSGEDIYNVPEYPYGMRVDVGDGEDVGVGSTFPRDYLCILADLMMLADGPCTMALDNDYPLTISFAIGDWDVLAMLAPIIED